jgi:UTP:GlnB (protein PII) uridylyltransferase
MPPSTPVPETRSIADVRVAVRALLEPSGSDSIVIDSLLGSAPASWWEASVSLLASDIRLLAPGLRPREVRLRIVPPAEGTRWEMSIVAPDRRGLLARTAQVCAQHGVSIAEARIASWPGLALQRLIVVPEQVPSSGEPDWTTVGQALRAALADEVGTSPVDASVSAGCDFAINSIEPQPDGSTCVRVSGADRVGLLAAIAKALSEAGADIQSAVLGERDGVAIDVFTVVAEDPELAGLANFRGGSSS